MSFINDWEKKFKDEIKKEKDYNLETLYEHTHEELSLQQSKRDQIITIYLALFSFLIPFALSLTSLQLWMKGLIFLVVAVIGVLFSFINVRYRIYKEIYWISCQAITVLMNVKNEDLNKSSIQHAFYYSLEKRGSAYLCDKGGEKVWSKKLFIKKNTFGAETFHHMIHVLIASSILALSVALILGDIFKLQLLICIGIASLVLIVTFILLMKSYFSKLMQVYSVLVYGNQDKSEKDQEIRNKLFNATFQKAWTLHVYYDNL